MYENIDILTNGFMFMFEYLKDTDYELAEKLSKFVLDGVGETEILLECAIKVSFNKAYCKYAIDLVKVYEDYMIEKSGSYLPYLVYSVKETIFRNMIAKESKPKSKRLYLCQMSNGTVKIGIADDVKRRISQIRYSSGMNVEKCLFTDTFDKAGKKETELHEKFKNTRKNGEFFSCKFSDVEKEIADIAKNEGIKIYYSAGKDIWMV